MKYILLVFMLIVGPKFANAGVDIPEPSGPSAAATQAAAVSASTIIEDMFATPGQHAAGFKCGSVNEALSRLETLADADAQAFLEQSNIKTLKVICEGVTDEEIVLNVSQFYIGWSWPRCDYNPDFEGCKSW